MIAIGGGKKAGREKSLHQCSIGVFKRGEWRTLVVSTNHTYRKGEMRKGHAEREALNKLKKLYPKKTLANMKLCMLISRMTADGNSAMSKPCPKCSNYLTNYENIKVYYTVDP